ncbi:MAG: heat-inducible transcriptional repressor HrcA, partial [Boseongicola sp. SB0664_bin_43]|nr:heat-inducible transcriptional repressor HrcA [Boseongicola sp. SB0664_bin_43]
MTDAGQLLEEMNERSREVFRRVVEAYLETGDPVGSRKLTRELNEKVSAATVRNVMQDLEYLGLLASPHSSAGRFPTESGLRLFVDGMMEVGDPSSQDREAIESELQSTDESVVTLLDRVGSALSGVTQGASLVLAPKHDAAVRHIE